MRNQKKIGICCDISRVGCLGFCDRFIPLQLLGEVMLFSGVHCLHLRPIPGIRKDPNIPQGLDVSVSLKNIQPSRPTYHSLSAPPKHHIGNLPIHEVQCRRTIELVHLPSS